MADTTQQATAHTPNLFERICANCQRPEGEHAHIGDSCPTFTGPRLYDAIKKSTPVAHARRNDPETIPEGFYRHKSGEIRRKTRKTHKHAPYTINPDPIARFWEKVNKTETCWLWTGSTDDFGYGVLGWNGQNARAHRISYELANGTIPEALQVLHKCDVPACINPEHLFLGTQSENIRDAISKGRFTQKTITNEMAEVIREEYRTNGASQRNLSKKFGVSQSSIGRVLHAGDKAWARKTDRITSKQAAASVRNITWLHEKIQRLFRSYGPMTDEQLWNSCQRDTLPGAKHSVSPSGLRSRRSELVRMGLVVDSGKVGKTASGRQTIIWKVAK